MILNDYFNEKEGYKIPQLLTDALLGDGREALLKYLDEHTPDKFADSLRDDYQNEHGDRDKLKQDFTPDGIVRVVRGIVGDGHRYADICAGTGALTLANMRDRADYTVYAEDFSERTVPFLLANLALRNAEGYVVNGDSLTGEIKALYKLEKSETYSRINIANDEIKDFQPPAVDHVIMNPPYSVKWKPRYHRAYDGYGPMPTTADYAFMLRGLDIGDTVTAIIPHGVLFRGAKEGKVRKLLIERNLLDAVIGLPENMFLNTGIPVAILVFNRKKTDDTVLFVDASRDFEKQGKINIMTDEQINKLIKTVIMRQVVDKYSHLATFEEIENNDFNLNIPRYVDTTEPPPPVDVVQDMLDLVAINKEIKAAELELGAFLDDLVGTTPQSQEELEKIKELHRELRSL